MKRTILHAMFFIGIISTAYAQTPGLGNYIPYHLIFAQNSKMLPGISKSAQSRSALYKEVAMRHDKYNEGTAAFEFNDSINFFYKGVGLLDLVLDSSDVKVYDTNDLQWLSNSRTLYNSSADGTFDTIHQQAWNAGSSTWVDSIVTYYTYNSNSLLLTKSFTESTLNGTLTINDTNYLNAAGTLDSISIIDSTTNNPSFIGYEINNVYDVNGKLISTTESVRQGSDQAYVPITSAGFTYNGSGLLSSETDSIFQLSNVVLTGKATYTYNSSGSILLEMDSSWDASNVRYQPTIEQTYVYDANNNDTLYQASGWDSSVQKWIPINQYNYQYDVNNNNVYELHSGFTYDVSNNSLTQLLEDQYFYYYNTTHQLEGITVVNNAFGINVSPNPAGSDGSVLNFTLESPAEMDMLVYDITGKSVLSTSSNFNAGLNSVNIATSALTSGLYTIKLMNPANGNSSVVKLVKE